MDMGIHQTSRSKTRTKVRVAAFVIFFPTLLIALSLWIERLLGLPRVGPLPVNLLLFVLFFLPGLLLARSANNHLKEVGKGSLYPSPESETKVLVTSGLYAHVRNPMVLGTFLMLVGISSLLGSFVALVLGPVLWLAVYSLIRRRKEEKVLEERFGEEYREYKKRVPMLLPRWSSIGLFLKLLMGRAERNKRSRKTNSENDEQEPVSHAAKDSWAI